MEIQRKHVTDIYVVKQDRHSDGEDVEIIEASNMDNSNFATSSHSPHMAKPISLVRLFLACMVAGGVQYGWALQLSLLTPYIQVCFFETKHVSSTTLHMYVLMDAVQPMLSSVHGWLWEIFWDTLQIFLAICLTVTLIFAKEVPLRAPAQDPQALARVDSKGEPMPSEGEERTSFLAVFKAFKNLPPGMPSVLIVTALTWLSWFPFILYDTDWMGREIYHGNPKGTAAEIDAYNRGVRQGAFGLLLNSLPLTASLLQVLFSVPFAVTAQLVVDKGIGGQGLCTGVLNISIVIPQVCFRHSPWDALFGKGNLPAFALASAIAFVCGIVGLFMLPRLSRSNFTTSGVAGGH
ncbi:hypothetical protein GW17_00018979 [Ensete ventricosum]|nr:hypothetical protein GW17_00018979 [Ensete ventricosum]